MQSALGRLETISIHVLREEDDGTSEAFRCIFQHFYPRPPRGGRPYSCQERCSYNQISIHVLREEDDPAPAGHGMDSLEISIHVLREEDDASITASRSRRQFLSTSSARRTTNTRLACSDYQQYFYPRPPRGGRPMADVLMLQNKIFLSTSSARRTTQPCRQLHPER